MRDHAPLDWGTWRRWVFANAWSELIGLGGSAGLALLLFGVALAEEGAVAVILGATVMVVLGTVLEGGIVGLAQWLVLRRRLDTLAARAWIGATALGAFVAWLLGMMPNTIMALRETGAEAAAPEFSFGAVMGMAIVMGLMLGPILAFFQWRVLRRHLRRAGWWIPANALAWAVGMMIIFIGAGGVPAGASPFVIGAVVAGTCLAAGAVVGAVHGLVLIWLLKDVTRHHKDIETIIPPA